MDPYVRLISRDVEAACVSRRKFLGLQKKEEKPKEIKLEWSKGLVHKREAETRFREMEAEKNKPFARSMDDPDLDRLLKERVRWDDPMARLIKRKHLDPVMDTRKKESGSAH